MKKAFIIIVVLIILFGVFSIFYFSKTPIEELNKKGTNRILVFSNKDTLYISASSWGLAGNHQEIVFSENPITIPNKETDYIFYTDEIQYKTDKNTLTIYAPQSGKNIPKTSFKNIEVVFKGLKTYDEIRDYNTNYQKYGLQRISVYD